MLSYGYFTKACKDEYKKLKEYILKQLNEEKNKASMNESQIADVCSKCGQYIVIYISFSGLGIGATKEEQIQQYRYIFPSTLQSIAEDYQLSEDLIKPLKQKINDEKYDPMNFIPDVCSLFKNEKILVFLDDYDKICQEKLICYHSSLLSNEDFKKTCKFNNSEPSYAELYNERNYATNFIVNSLNNSQKNQNKVQIFIFGQYNFLNNVGTYNQLNGRDLSSLQLAGIPKEELKKEFIQKIIETKYHRKPLAEKFEKVIFDLLESCYNGYNNSELMHFYYIERFFYFLLENIIKVQKPSNSQLTLKDFFGYCMENNKNPLYPYLMQCCNNKFFKIYSETLDREQRD